MPGGDRTGPLGYGPMTGRGADYRAPGYVHPGYGRGSGFGCGGRRSGGVRGWWHTYFATGLPGWARGYGANPPQPGNAGPGYRGEYTPEQEMNALKAQSDFFQKQIEMLNQRIRELEDIAAKKGDSSE